MKFQETEKGELLKIAMSQKLQEQEYQMLIDKNK